MKNTTQRRSTKDTSIQNLTRQELEEKYKTLLALATELVAGKNEVLLLIEQLIHQNKKDIITLDELEKLDREELLALHNLEQIHNSLDQFIIAETKKHARPKAGRRPKDDYDKDILEFISGQNKNTSHHHFIPWYYSKKREKPQIGKTAYGKRVKFIKANIKKD